MARLDDLVAEVRDIALRSKLQEAVADLKKKKRFGLVFEEHVPETSALAGLPVNVGTIVQRRDDLSGRTYVVKDVVNGQGKVIVAPIGGGDAESVSRKDLLVVKRFGDPIYPALTSVGTIRRGPASAPYHAVINGENFHALQLFTYLYQGKVDCIYIDPPYNSGSRDWKYNNHYVDKNDAWRHSKWLAFMDRRLSLAKSLLNPYESVLIVTIDEKECLHLGLLLERVFSGCNIQMVSTLINPASVARAGSFGRSDEYIFFVSIGTAVPQRVRLARDWVSAKGSDRLPAGRLGGIGKLG